MTWRRFLWQARANIPGNLRDVLIEEYINEARMVSQDFNENKFREFLPFFCAVQNASDAWSLWVQGMD